MKKEKIKSLILCVVMLLLSPFIANQAVKGVNSAQSAAEDFGFESIPETEIAVIGDIEENSEGFGWEEEETTPNDVITSNDTQIDEGFKPYPTEWTENGGKVFKTFYSTAQGDYYINLDRAGQVRNASAAVSNAKLLDESRKLPEFRIQYNSDEPQVLIMHTHTTESFEPYERKNFDSSFNYRTTDPTKNIVAVGNAISQELEAAGIRTIHDTTIHDFPSYNGSYEASAETVKKILEEYPSIKIVLDVHRDAIVDGKNLPQPVVSVNGKDAAQIMLISCCDDGTGNLPNYMKNYRFAVLMQQQLENDYRGLTRPVLFDERFYNQDLTTGSILIEVGSHGNTLEQVIYSGELIGKSLSRAFLQIAS